MAAGAGMTLAQIDLERPGHDVCAQDVVGVALVATTESHWTTRDLSASESASNSA